MTPTAPTQPTHGCARCGAPVGPGVGLCDTCNPIGLRDVAASQVHGTVIIAVLVGFVLLAVLARLAIAGAGPYPARIDAVAPAGSGLVVTLSVANEGSAQGQTTCRLSDPAQRAGGPVAFALSPEIAAGGSVTFKTETTVFGAVPRDLAVECRTP